MFESYFFDKRATTNYRVFRVMKALADANFTVNKLSQVTKLSYSQTYNAFQDIMADLQALDHTPVNHVNEIAFAELAKTMTVDQYRFHLLQSSIAFQFFDYLFKTKDPDVHEFCAVNQLSISTLRRRIDPFKAYIQSKGITLNPSTWALEGPEMQIRLLILTFFQLAYRGNGWPFNETNLVATRAQYGAIEVQLHQAEDQPHHDITKQDLLTLAVQELRITQGHVLAESDRLMLLVMSEAPQPLPLVFTSQRFGALSSTQLATESAFYYFLRIHFISIEANVDATDQWLLDHFAATDNLVARFAGGLLDALCQALPATSAAANPANHRVLEANLMRLAFSYYLLGGDFAKRTDFYRTDAQAATHGQLPDLIHHFFEALPADSPAAVFKGYWPQMAGDLYRVIRPDFPALDLDHQLRVCVLIEPGTFIIRDLLMFLNKISFVTLQQTPPQTAPDVLITTLTNRKLLHRFFPQLANNAIQVIQWQNEASDNDFFQLYHQLAAALARKAKRVKV